MNRRKSPPSRGSGGAGGGQQDLVHALELAHLLLSSRIFFASSVVVPRSPAGEIRRLAFGTLPPIEAWGRIRDAIREYDGA